MKKLKKFLIAICITVVIGYFLIVGLFALSVICTQSNPTDPDKTEVSEAVDVSEDMI